MKRFLTLLFTTLLLTAALCVTASASDFDAVAEDLSAIGMFRGTASGFELDRAPTRSEAAIMLVRLYGAEEKAKTAYEAGEIKHPFTDVSEFTSPYVAWLYTNGITTGTSATTFGSTSKCSAQNYVVFLLRALGYKDGIDFQYADAKDFAVTKGLMDPSFYTGEFLRDDLAAVTYQALACGLADGSTYLLDSLVKSGAIDKTAAKPMTDKITTYRSMVSSTVGAMQDSIDAGFTMKMNMDMDMKGTSEGQPMDASAGAVIDAKGSMQMVLDKDMQMALQMDMNMDMNMKDASSQTVTMSQPVSMGMWFKDNWMYVQQGETCYKQDMGDSMGEFMELYQELMGQVSGTGASSAAIMMPYLGEITAKKSGSDTVYTLTLNDKAYMGLMDDIIGMVTSAMGEEIGLALDMDLSDCTYTYTVGSKGQLKNMTAVAKLSMKMDMSEGEETVAMAANISMDMAMKVNATGSSVKVSYPDLSKFEDIASIIEEPIQAAPVVDAAGAA